MEILPKLRAQMQKNVSPDSVLVPPGMPWEGRRRRSFSHHRVVLCSSPEGSEDSRPPPWSS